MPDADYWMTHLQLSPHPEGGYFGETFRTTEKIPPSGLPVRYSSARATVTAIYFLLRSGEVSKFHRLQSDEIWCYHAGRPLTLYLLAPDGLLETRRLGLALDHQEQPQLCIPHGVWFAAHLAPEQTATDTEAAYTLVSCIVAPGFDYADFELATRASLLAAYPQYADLIVQFT